MNFEYSPGPECDTCRLSDNNHAEIYLYDASPFVLRDDGGENVVSAYIHDMNWLSDDGFRPIEGIPDTEYDDKYDIVKTGKYVTADSAIGMECHYYVPLDSDTCGFILQKLIFTNNTNSYLYDVYFGNVIDWNVPSDSGNRNSSGFDIDRNSMFQSGFEASQADTFCGNSMNGNDCTDSDLRFGGVSYQSGTWYHSGGLTNANAIQGMFTHMVPEYIPGGHIDPDLLYDKLSTFSGYESWEGTVVTGPESLYQDIATFMSFGEYDLGANDSLIFNSIFAVEYDGGLSGFQEKIDAAVEYGGVDYVCGDANGDMGVSVFDAIFLINYLRKGGPAPDPLLSGDVDGYSGITMNDVEHLIFFIFTAGPDPICPPDPFATLPVFDVDTLKVSSVIVPPGETYWEVDLTQYSQDSIVGVSMPIAYSSPKYELEQFDVDYAGSIYEEYVDASKGAIIDRDESKLFVSFTDVSGTLDVPYPSAGHIATLKFNVKRSHKPQYIKIDTTLFPPSNITIFSKEETNIQGFKPVLLGVHNCVDTDGDDYGNPGNPDNTCLDDNCPSVYNPDQSDLDGDGIGDACDACTDVDGDGYGEPGLTAQSCDEDNCPTISNPSQTDSDFDGIGDACDLEESTPGGTDVLVNLGSGFTMEFETVNTAGNSTIEVTTEGIAPDDMWDHIEDHQTIYYNIETTTDFTGEIEFCISYDDYLMFPDEESELRLFHYLEGPAEWISIETSIDTAANILCGKTTSLSTFGGGKYIQLCGDADKSGAVNILDVVFLINYKYKEGPEPLSPAYSNVDCISPINILDIVYLINYKYKDGPMLNCCRVD